MHESFLRSMVYKIWSPQILRRLAKYETNSPSHFYFSQWQKSENVSIWYVLYRLFLAFFTLGVMVYSIIYQSDENPEASRWKWLIFMTHWGYAMLVFQFILGAFIVCKQYMGTAIPDTTLKPQIPMLYQFYAVMNATAIVLAVSITALYWTLIHDPAIHKLSIMNMMLHAINSVIMIVDLLIVKHSMRMCHCYWPFFFAVIYTVFTYCYYLAGGTGKNGDDFIYPILNWSRPGKTIVVVICAIVYMVFMFYVIYGISALRRFIKIASKSYAMNEKPNEMIEKRRDSIRIGPGEIVTATLHDMV